MKKRRRGFGALPAAHEESAERHMRSALVALREERPCAALREAHYAEVELHYATSSRRGEMLDDLGNIINEAGRGCVCSRDRSPGVSRPRGTGWRW